MTIPPAPYRPQQDPTQGFAGLPGPPPLPHQPAPQAPGGAGGMPPTGRHGPGAGGPPQHPPSFGPPSHTCAARAKGANAIWGLGLASAAAVIAGLSIPEDGATGWDTVHAWGGLAILGALLTLAPVALSGLTAARAWQASVCGAGALVLFWVLFVLPAAGSNTSLVATVGVAAGVIATWIAPGREPVGDRPSRNTW
ncbi:hypothetical protein [Jatrophihabitans fulvus]